MPKNKFKMEIRENAIDIFIYENIDSGGWFSESSSNELKKTLDENENVNKINVHINSLGGDVFEGIAMYNLLKQSKAYVTVYIDSIAASIASIIALAGDKIIMPKNTMMMIHNCWTYGMGNSKDFRKLADDLEKIMESLKETYLAKGNEQLTVEKLDKLLDEETFLTAEECFFYGLCDEVSDITDEKNMMELISVSDAFMNKYHAKLQERKEVDKITDDETKNMLFDLFSKFS